MSPRIDKPALRRLLRRRHAWLAHPEFGPAAVTAGECDRCGEEPRMVQPCGPVPTDLSAAATRDWALGRACASAIGVDAWCGGHEREARAALRWLAELPQEADDIARLWWLATGEIRPDPLLVHRVEALMAELDGAH